MSQMKVYCNKIVEVMDDEKLSINFFQESLSGVVLSWYIQLDNNKVRKWKDLMDITKY